MSIFEIIGELVNPGPVGSIDFKDERKDPRKKFITVRFVISMLILGFAEYMFIVKTGAYIDLVYVLKVNVIISLYLLIAYRLRVKADSRNMGWVPFLIDNPFRISDDFNRFLAILNVLFLPGKYISRSIVDYYWYAKSEY